LATSEKSNDQGQLGNQGSKVNEYNHGCEAVMETYLWQVTLVEASHMEKKKLWLPFSLLGKSFLNKERFFNIQSSHLGSAYNQQST
jgi:hypothetical protein